MTEEQYQELFDKQDGKCAVCFKSQDKEKHRFHVDHAHKSSDFVPEGAIRGLLCSQCNQKVISNHVDPILFENSAKYLKQHTGLFVPDDMIKPPRRGKKRKKKNQ